MNSIEKLIAKLCPNGVEFKTLQTICKLKAGDRIIKSMMNNHNNYVVMGGGTEPTGYYHSYNFEKAITISRAGSAGYVSWQNDKFWATDVCFVASESKENDIKNINLKFIYYFLKNHENEFKKNLYGASMPKLNKTYLWNLAIPIPPLEIQNKIVAILDTFTELEKELEKELALRKKQYEYYRDFLLSYDELERRAKMNASNKDNVCNLVQWVSLGEIAYYPKERIKANYLNNFNYVSVENLLQDKLGKADSNKVPLTGNMIKYKNNDCLIGNIRPYLRKIWFANNEGGTNGDVLLIRIKSEFQNILKEKFLYHNLASEIFCCYHNKNSKGAKMPRGDKQAILNFKIPLPPLAVQQEIVSILDTFESLVNDFNSGIPQEIQARKKQYEYYRDRLLHFKELESQSEI